MDRIRIEIEEIKGDTSRRKGFYLTPWYESDLNIVEGKTIKIIETDTGKVVWEIKEMYKE
jgi:hypothetical protein